MRYDNPQLIDQLASAYVLGTLHGLARRRFQQLARESRVVQQAVWRWERRINPMADGARPVAPDPAVWQRIESAIAPEASRPPRGEAWWWRGLSGALAVTVFALLILTPTTPPVETPILASEQISLIQDDASQPLWVISVDVDTGRLKSRAINVPAREADRVFELWMLPADGPPRSIGLLPVVQDQRATRDLSPALLALLRSASGIAVSIEPPGGSPTGAPTGPVVYSAPIVEL